MTVLDEFSFPTFNDECRGKKNPLYGKHATEHDENRYP